MSATLISPPPYSSPEWVDWRRNGLGASDLPTIVGCNPYQGEYQLWAQKRGLTPAFEGNAATRWGHRMETLGIEVYQETTGLEVIRGETFADDRWPNLWATLDGRVAGTRRGVEIKYASRAWDGIPERVTVQALAQMGIGDLESVDVVHLTNHGEPTVHRIERVDSAIADLLDVGEAWWTRYVIGDEEPPFDGSPEARRALDRLVGAAEIKADADQTAAVMRLRDVRAGIKRLEAEDDGLVRAIKASMAGGGLLTGTGFRVVWAPVKGRTTTDWKAVALTALPQLPPDVGDELVQRYTTQGEGGTRFAPKWDEETA